MNKPNECVGVCVLAGHRGVNPDGTQPTLMDAYCSTCGHQFGEMTVADAEVLFEEFNHAAETE
mgnify:FL=1